MNNKNYPFYFVTGALVLYLFLFVIPGFMGIGYAFTDWSSYSREIKFVGFENFKTIFSSGEKYMSYNYTLPEFTIITTIMKTILGLGFALLLNKGIRGKNFHRAVIFMPAILS